MATLKTRLTKIEAKHPTTNELEVFMNELGDDELQALCDLLKKAQQIENGEAVEFTAAEEQAALLLEQFIATHPNALKGLQKHVLEV